MLLGNAGIMDDDRRPGQKTKFGPAQYKPIRKTDRFLLKTGSKTDQLKNGGVHHGSAKQNEQGIQIQPGVG